VSEFKENQEVFSEKVRAGKRTYFFDIKATRGGDYYLTITESKKEFSDDKPEFYKKRTIFLYKEDVRKFESAFNKSISQLQILTPEYNFDDHKTEE
jgi:hypothetical protein